MQHPTGPPPRATWRKVSRQRIRPLLAFSGYAFLPNVALLITLRIDPIAIKLFLPMSAIAVYAIAAKISEYVFLLNKQFSNALMPLVSQLHGRGEANAIRLVMMDGTRFLLAFALPGITLLFYYAPEFIHLWLGDEFVSGEEFVSSGVILGLLAFGTLLRCSVSTAKQVCFGLREVRFLSRVTMLEALVNLVLTVVLTWQLGILGAALAGVIAVTVTQVWMLPRFVAKRIHAPLLSYIAAVPWPPLLVFATVGTLSYLSQGWDVGSSMGTFLLKAVVIGVPALFVGAAYGTTPEEKQRLLRSLRKAA